MTDMVQIKGTIGVQGGNDAPIITAKAYSVTVRTVDDSEFRGDSAWLPKSIATDAQVRETREGGVVGYEISATVPAWWVKKIDTRPSWQRRGFARPPHGQRPF